MNDATPRNMVHILLVEDDAVDVDAVARALSENKVANPLHVANNGQMALDMLRGSKAVEKLSPTPKIILLDINMPVMDGLEFLEIIRRDDDLKRLQVFILTTSDDESDKLRAGNLNVAGYIVKPVRFGKFVEAMRTLNNYWQLSELP